jgi:hypothetical protein
MAIEVDRTPGVIMDFPFRVTGTFGDLIKNNE